MEEWYVILGKVTSLEPLVITNKHNVGGFYRGLDYIPASTLGGAILASYLREMIGEDAKRMKNRVWVSHAYPCTKEEIQHVRIEGPLPLPLRTLARKKQERSEEKIVSIALLVTKLIDTGDIDLAGMLVDLDPKVGTMYVYPSIFPSSSEYMIKEFRPPARIVCTHVPLSYDTRTAARIPTGERGLLYTVEVIQPLETFVFKAFIGRELLEYFDEKGWKLKVKIGSHKKKGYGESIVEVTKHVMLEEYKDKRLGALAEADTEYVTADAGTHLQPAALQDLGELVYQKTAVINLKLWQDGRFIIYNNLFAPGSVLVYKKEYEPEKYVELEIAPLGLKGDKSPELVQGLNMFFLNNPIHFLSLLDLNR